MELLFFSALLLLVFLSEYSHKWVFDDAYMFVRYARNILDGKGYVWNPGGPRIDGLTSPFWLLVVIYTIRVFQVSPAYYGSMLYSLSFISGILLILVFYYTVKRLLPSKAASLAPLFTLLVILSPFGVHNHFGNGMETTMAASLLALYLFFLIRISESPAPFSESLSLGILGFLCVMARPEFALIILLSPFLLWLRIGRSFPKRREPLIVLLTSCVLLIVYALWRLVYFGEIFPNSFYVKGSLWFTPYEDFNAKERTRLVHIPLFYFRESLFLHLVLFFGLMQRKNWKKLLWLWAPLYLSLIYISTALQIMGYGYRYFFPFMGGVVYLIILTWSWLLEDAPPFRSRNSRIPAWIFCVIVSLSLIAINAGYVDLYINFKKENEDNKDYMMEFFRKLPPGASIAATEVGAISTRSPHIFVHDLSGLNDPEFRRGFRADDLFRRNPDIICYVHEHYGGINKRIREHPSFSRYLRAINFLRDKTNSSLGSAVYVNIDSTRANEILNLMRQDKNLNEYFLSMGAKVGFDLFHFPPILDSEGRHPLLGPFLGKGYSETCRETLKPDIGNPFSLLVGSGWSPPETWKNFGNVLPMEGQGGVLFLPLDSPSTTTVSISFYPYQHDYPPKLKLKLFCNNHDILDEYCVHSNRNFHKWTIPQHILRKGINELVLMPNRTISPKDVDPESQDPRHLSIWLYSVEYALER
ncbi:hypothetical protein JW926_10815 [Candidatus Sumerlaeota bacterium]|nr:hypothetical protein [Candidatus Sumerlaeota bacterium]